MQRRMMDKLQTKKVKLEMLHVYWDNVVSTLESYINENGKGTPYFIKFFYDELK